MNPIDIRDFALNVSDTISRLAAWTLRGPLLITRDGQPEAVIIRHQAWAPKLQDFDITRDGDVRCKLCPVPDIIVAGPTGLGAALDAANRHWNAIHRTEQKAAQDAATMAQLADATAEG